MFENLKIYFVMDPIRGGGSRNVFTLVKLLDDLGSESKVLSFHSMKYLDLLWRRKPVFNFYGARRISPGNMLSMVDSITSFSENLNYWVLPVYVFQQFFTRPIILSRYDTPDVYIATNWQSFVPTVKTASRYGRRVAYFVQGDETEFSDSRLYRKEALRTYTNDFPKFTQSRWLAEEMSRKFSVVVNYVGFGIDHMVFYPREVEKENVIFTIARSEKIKGFSSFINAVNRLWAKRQDFKVLIAGHKNIVDKSAMEFPYTYLGWITDDEEMARLYSKSIFVNTGLNEALPMPPLEAMACGGTVVMTSNGGSVEYAKDMENCLLVNPNDDSELTNKLDFVLSTKGIRDELKKGAISTAMRYNWQDFMQNFRKFMEKEVLK